MRFLVFASSAAVLLGGCAQSDMSSVDPNNNSQPVSISVPEPVVNASPELVDNGTIRNEVAFIWPSSLVLVGTGYPAAGDPCRQLGESALTADYLDHTATLVGCPTAAHAEQIKQLIDKGGKQVGAADGVTFISVPNKKG